MEASLLTEPHPYPVIPMPTCFVREAPSLEPPKPKLLDLVRREIRTRHYSRKTEKAYVGWIRRYIFFYGKSHPAEMGEPEISKSLTHLAVNGKVSASTQNQALSALLFPSEDTHDRSEPRPAIRDQIIMFSPAHRTAVQSQS